MKKKKKDKNKSLDYICNEVVKKCEIKYHKYNEYLSSDFYEKLTKELHECYRANSGISPDVYLMIMANSLILKELGKIARNDGIEVEISLIEDKSTLLYIIMMKMGYTPKEIRKYSEDILIDAIETYDGVKTFGQHLVKCVKKFKTTKSEDITDKISGYLNQNKIDMTSPSYLELLCNYVNIINALNDESAYIKDFIYLKYGFYKNIYFNLEQISEILNIDIKTTKQYYIDSLEILRQLVNEYVDKIISYDVEFTDSKSYIIKK